MATTPKQKAVPYVPPQAPNKSYQQRFRSPAMNGILLSVVIVFGGFMTYNFVGNQLTQLSGQSDIREAVVTPTPTPDLSITPTIIETAPTAEYTP